MLRIYFHFPNLFSPSESISTSPSLEKEMGRFEICPNLDCKVTPGVVPIYDIYTSGWREAMLYLRTFSELERWALEVPEFSEKILATISEDVWRFLRMSWRFLKTFWTFPGLSPQDLFCQTKYCCQYYSFENRRVWQSVILCNDIILDVQWPLLFW